MLVGPAGQVICMDAWVMGFRGSAGMLAEGTSAAVIKFNGWSHPVPSGFEPSDAVVTRLAPWFADNGFMAMFVKLPNGEKLLLDHDDSRRLLLEPLYVTCVGDYFGALNDHNLTWSLTATHVGMLQIETLGHCTDGRTITLDRNAFQSLADTEPPKLGNSQTRTSSELQSILGMLSYVAQGIPTPAVREEFERLRLIARSPLAVTESRIGAHNYGPAQQEAICQARDLLLSELRNHRGLLDPDAPALATADASQVGWSFTLWQVGPNGRMLAVRMVAGRWAPGLDTSKTMRLEAGAITLGSRELNDIFVQLRVVLLRVDARVLLWWMHSTDPALRRWYLELTQYLNLYTILHGIQHINGLLNPADYNSRMQCMPIGSSGRPVVDLLGRDLTAANASSDAIAALVQAAEQVPIRPIVVNDAEFNQSLALPVSRVWQPPTLSAVADDHGPLLPSDAQSEIALRRCAHPFYAPVCECRRWGGGGSWS
jgi:hypothetical protein